MRQSKINYKLDSFINKRMNYDRTYGVCTIIFLLVHRQRIKQVPVCRNIVEVQATAIQLQRILCRFSHVVVCGGISVNYGLTLQSLKINRRSIISIFCTGNSERMMNIFAISIFHHGPSADRSVFKQQNRS